MMHDRGLCKLAKECGELIQDAMKLSSYPDNDHPSGVDVREKLTEEIADVLAAINFVIEKHRLNFRVIEERRAQKLEIFKSWDTEDD